MKLLIVESNLELSQVWSAHLERQGAEVCSASNEAEAIEVLGAEDIDIIVLDLVLKTGSAFAVADLPAIAVPTRASSLSPTPRSFPMGRSFSIFRTPARFYQSLQPRKIWPLSSTTMALPKNAVNLP